MARDPEPTKKHQHIHAIVRFEVDADDEVPIDLRITVQKMVVDPQHGEAEVERLDDPNAGKNNDDFSQVTRSEDSPMPLEAASAPGGVSWHHAPDEATSTRPS